MAELWQAAIDLASSDPTTFGIILLVGFLLGHFIHSFLYGFIYKFGNPIEKFKMFFKHLFFLKVQ